jgi:Spy/CpxP family protein refolding chaperone
MTPQKLLSVLVGLLVLMNVALMVTLMDGRVDRPPPPPPGRGGEPPPLRQTIEGTLGFDADQRAQFDESRRRYQDGLRDLDRRRRSLIESYFATATPDLDARAQLLEVEAAKIDLTSTHFREIREIATEQQLARFPEVLDAALRVMLGGPGGPGEPGRGRPRRGGADGESREGGPPGGGRRGGRPPR